MPIEGLEIQYNDKTGEERCPSIKAFVEKINEIVQWISRYEVVHERNKKSFDVLLEDHARLVNLVEELHNAN